MKRKVIVLSLILVIINFVGPYKYDNNKAINYIKQHKSSKSKSMCAWYVMQALRYGGCRYCYIYPAYAYNKVLPKLGFEEVPINDYVPQKGDISVLPTNVSSVFGHIAIYDGNCWISDFEQKSIFPGKYYKQNGKYQIYRIKNGWHWAFMYENPKNLIEYLSVLFKGWNKIKF